MTIKPPFDTINFSNSFLLAMPNLDGSFFERKIVYVVDHNEEGALGIIINHALKEVSLNELFLVEEEQLDKSVEFTEKLDRLSNECVYQGGPVQVDRGFILHEGGSRWASTINIEESGLALTTSNDLLEKIFKGDCWERYMVALGYSGWGANQLDEEIKESCWWVMPAFKELIFDVPCDQRWSVAAEQLGIDMSALSREHGIA